MGRRTVKQHPNYENTFDFFDGKKQVATVTIYDDGLIEYKGKIDVAIENIGTNKEALIVGSPNGSLTIKTAV